MTLLASVRLVRNLGDPGARATSVIGPDAAHHVLDPEGLLGLDPLHATDLDTALPLVRAREPQGWVLVLPVPGRLGGLRGPVALNQAALLEGAAVIGVRGGFALVPHPVGPAVQWRVFAAAPPAPVPSTYEAERTLSETVLAAGTALARLDVAAGQGPTGDLDLGPAPGYPARRRVAAERAARLLVACDHALAVDGASLSSYEVAARRRELEAVRDAARDALVAAVSWSDARR